LTNFIHQHQIDFDNIVVGDQVDADQVHGWEGNF
jgi:hypothetical protein